MCNALVFFNHFDLRDLLSCSNLIRVTGFINDIDYYLSQQILPVVSRLCASIQGTSLERLADCLGLDSSKVSASFKTRL